MVDFETLVIALRNSGYTVEHTIETPGNAGNAELVIDGKLLTLDEARALVDTDAPRKL